MASTEPPAVQEPRGNEPKVNILLVDDRADKLKATAAVLEELGENIVCATSGPEALRHLLHQEFAVILIDVSMPEMDGFDLARLIRQRRRTAKTPIIFYTASAEAATRLTTGYQLGAIDFLNAPVPPDVLRAKVQLLADLHRRIRDVERRAGERERLLRAEAARADAERASAAKDHFLAMLSHELRTPLSPVINTVSMLLDDTSCGPAVRDGLEIIRRNVMLEARLIDDLLDLTRVSRGKISLHPELLDAHELLRRVVEICEPEIQEKRLTLSFEFRAARTALNADAARLQQIFWNLIKNAVQFTPAGGRVVVSTHNTDNDRLAVEIADTGIGIRQDLLADIFSPFRPAPHSSGTLGLGLAIARALVDLHGGSLSAASEGHGRGSTFRVLLPLRAAAATAPCPTGEAAEPADAARHSARLLLVEDHDDTRKTLARLLERRGYTLRAAADVASAIETASEYDFDILISDIGLPDGTGVDLMRRLSAAGPIPGIALSGYGRDEDVKRSLAAGFAQHLTKPIEFHHLDSAIQSLAVR